MPASKASAVGLLVTLLAAHVVRAEIGEFQRQSITVPTKSVASLVWSLFADVEGDGLADLLAVGPVENRLWIYCQRASGFSDQPDQAVTLPSQTAWIAVCDVDAHPGPELLLSTAAGLVFLRQDGGVFDSRQHTLVEASQVFTNGDPPMLVRSGVLTNGTNLVIPVISAGSVELYERTEAFKWRLGERLDYVSQQAQWMAQDDEWTMGSRPSRGMRIRQFSRTKPDDNPGIGQKPENEAIKRIILEKGTERSGREHGLDRVDVNGDGRVDVIVWKFAWDVDPKTDAFVFLRGADGQLPEQPSQVLHARGFPLCVGPRHEVSPVCDLDGDGACELVLLTLKAPGMSSGSVLEMVISRGMDWKLTIRSFERGAFARSPEASIGITTVLPTAGDPRELFVLDADFNGDGRRDVLARRSLTEWDVFLSSNGGQWFTPQPVRTIEVPLEGDFEIQDLNNDGVSDIVVRGRDEPRLLILLSQSPRKKGPQR